MSLFAGLESIEEIKSNDNIADILEEQYDSIEELYNNDLLEGRLALLSTVKKAIEKHGYTDSLQSIFGDSLDSIGIEQGTENIISIIDQKLIDYQYVDCSTERVMDFYINHPFWGFFVFGMTSWLGLGSFIVYLAKTKSDIKSYQSKYRMADKKLLDLNLTNHRLPIMNRDMLVSRLTKALGFFKYIDSTINGSTKLSGDKVKQYTNDVGVSSSFWTNFIDTFREVDDTMTLKEGGYKVKDFEVLYKLFESLTEVLASIDEKLKGLIKKVENSNKSNMEADSLTKSDLKQLKSATKSIIKRAYRYIRISRRVMRTIIGQTGVFEK